MASINCQRPADFLPEQDYLNGSSRSRSNRKYGGSYKKECASDVERPALFLGGCGPAAEAPRRKLRSSWILHADASNGTLKTEQTQGSDSESEGEEEDLMADLNMSNGSISIALEDVFDDDEDEEKDTEEDVFDDDGDDELEGSFDPEKEGKEEEDYWKTEEEMKYWHPAYRYFPRNPPRDKRPLDGVGLESLLISDHLPEEEIVFDYADWTPSHTATTLLNNTAVADNLYTAASAIEELLPLLDVTILYSDDLSVDEYDWNYQPVVAKEEETTEFLLSSSRLSETAAAAAVQRELRFHCVDDDGYVVDATFKGVGSGNSCWIEKDIEDIGEREESVYEEEEDKEDIYTDEEDSQFEDVPLAASKTSTFFVDDKKDSNNGGVEEEEEKEEAVCTNEEDLRCRLLSTSVVSTILEDDNEDDDDIDLKQVAVATNRAAGEEETTPDSIPDDGFMAAMVQEQARDLATLIQQQTRDIAKLQEENESLKKALKKANETSAKKDAKLELLKFIMEDTQDDE